MIDSLGKRLPRMPFPPITKDSNFDYESALNEHVRDGTCRYSLHAVLTSY